MLLFYGGEGRREEKGGRGEERSEGEKCGEKRKRREEGVRSGDGGEGHLRLRCCQAIVREHADGIGATVREHADVVAGGWWLVVGGRWSGWRS